MVHLKLRWSREHVEDFLENAQRLLKGNSDYFDVTFHLDGCEIKIDEGEIKQ